LSRASPPSPARELAESRFEDWVSNVDWFRPDAIDWVCAISVLSWHLNTDWDRTFGMETFLLPKPTMISRPLLRTSQALMVIHGLIAMF
jgi:hypothetical protein